MFKIEVECDKENNKFTVRVADRYQDELCWDEALGCLARLVINGPKDGGLRTSDQHAAYKQYLTRPISEDQVLGI
jgi:hypothetical protein